MICTLTTCTRDLCCQVWQLTQNHGPSTTNWYFRKPTWRVSERTLIHWFIFGKAELISPSHDVPDCFSIHPCIYPSSTSLILHSGIRLEAILQPDPSSMKRKCRRSRTSESWNSDWLHTTAGQSEDWPSLSRHDSSIVHPNEQTNGRCFMGRVPC